jgi:hypothetical protein
VQRVISERHAERVEGRRRVLHELGEVLDDVPPGPRLGVASEDQPLGLALEADVLALRPVVVGLRDDPRGGKLQPQDDGGVVRVDAVGVEAVAKPDRRRERLDLDVPDPRVIPLVGWAYGIACVSIAAIMSK